MQKPRAAAVLNAITSSLRPQFVSPVAFAKNFARILAALDDDELSRFLDQTRTGNSGTEVEALMIELIERHAAWRELRRADHGG